MNADPLPVAGDRVVLRRVVRADLAAFQAYRHDAEVGRYQGWTPMTDAQALTFIDEMATAPLFPAGAWVQIGIAARASGALIGDLGARVAADGASAEIGFTLARPVQGRGLGGEAVGLALALLFGRTGIARVEAITDARNASSIRLLERAGFRRAATADAVFRGERCVEHHYRLDRPSVGGAACARAHRR